MKQLKKDISQSQMIIFASNADKDYLVIDHLLKFKNYILYNERKTTEEIYKDIVNLSKNYDYVVFDKDVFTKTEPDPNGFMTKAKKIDGIVHKLKQLPSKFIIMSNTYMSSIGKGMRIPGSQKSYDSDLILHFDGEIIKASKNRFSKPNREIKFNINKLLLNKKLKKLKKATF